MPIINETWDDGKSYRVKQADGSWKKKSFLHKAKDLLFGDGSDLANNAENNLGAIKGLTKSTNVTEEGYAVDATVINQINSNMFNREFYNLPKIYLNNLITIDVSWFDAPYSGYYYMSSDSASNNNGYAFIRLGVEKYFYQQISPYGVYKRITSPVIYIKKGDKMIAQGSDTSGSSNILICFKDE